MIRVFLSYASEDRDRVEKLYHNLVAAGFEPWMDTHDLIPGEEWLKGIQRGLQSADCFLACVSPRSIQKDGVLGEEVRAALDRWRKRRGNYRLIPVRLADVKLPASLEHLQWYNLFGDEQWTGLAKVIRKRTRPANWAYAAAALVAVIALAGGAWWYIHRDKDQRWPPGPVRIGVTFWKLREAKPADVGTPKILVHPRSDTAAKKPVEYVPERVPLDTPFRIGDRVRVTFESAQPGFLYVIDRDESATRLIFPTRLIRGGNNEVQAATVVEIPPQDDAFPYFEFTELSDQYTGDLLTVVFAKQPIEDLKPGPDARDLDASWFRVELNRWGRMDAVAATDGGTPVTLAEFHAGKSALIRLGRLDPLPQTIFSGRPRRGEPMAATFPLRISR